MTNCLIITVAVLGSVSALLPRVRAGDAPGYSDIAKIGPDSFLVVNDRKRSAGQAYRLGVVTLTQHAGARFQPVVLAGWPDDVELPSDLEACCVLPGETLTILVAESGVWNHVNGRVFHLGLTQDAAGIWKATFLKSFAILQQGAFSRPLDPDGRSFEGNQVEGMAVVTKGDTIFLIYAERGGKTAEGKHQTGTLVWGKLDLRTYTFAPQSEAALVASSVLNDRDCSALHLVASAGQPGRYRVMSVATSDPSDTDVGPFTSILFQAGTLEINSAGDGLLYTSASEQEQHRLTVASIKVEGLTAPADAITQSTFTLASDDEDYGGIVRPVRWRAENARP